VTDAINFHAGVRYLARQRDKGAKHTPGDEDCVAHIR
jgi:hypothetical protein